MSEFLQFLFGGVTAGAVYALVALGFAIIFNASGIINFAQGEFVMIGGMASVFFASAGVPLPVAVIAAIGVAMAVGALLERGVIEFARNAETVSLIIITIGASILLQGVAQILFGKGQFALPAFSGDESILVGGAVIMPQSLWIIGVAALIMLVLWWFFNRSRWGKAMLAVAYNRTGAELAGIDVRRVWLIAFAMSAALGAMGGALAAPITMTAYDAGLMLGLKGFVAATLGGLGSGVGAVLGGLLLGIAEAMTAGYISTAYKDAVPFILILVLLFWMPRGLFGAHQAERV